MAQSFLLHYQYIDGNYVFSLWLKLYINVNVAKVELSLKPRLLLLLFVTANENLVSLINNSKIGHKA